MEKYTPFKLKFDTIEKYPILSWLSKPMIGYLERILGFQRLTEILHGHEQHPGNFFDGIIASMGVSYELEPAALERIPEKGPVVIVANHPYGGLEAVITASIVLRRRADLRIMGNYLLSRIHEMRPHLIQVDPFDSKTSIRTNIGPLRNSIDWLKNDGILLTYPAGTVSHFSYASREISDPPWDKSIARIIRKTNSTVIPIYFPGHNGPLFQLSGLIHPVLRTAQIPRELAKLSNRSFHPIIGRPIDPSRIASHPDDQKLISYCRMRTYILAKKQSQSDASPLAIATAPTVSESSTATAVNPNWEPVSEPVSFEKLEEEIRALPKSRLILKQGEFEVYCTRSRAIPNVLQEIGRLRELTFRAVQEGTGKPLDLDRFDDYYHHLFIWNNEKKEIVGAYRLTKIDRIVRLYGVRGLYTYTLFKYKASTMAKIGPALELGRSFVRDEYQRSFSALQLLWRGVAHYVALNPRYRVLLGPVSISAQYPTVSRMLITSFLQVNNYKRDIARFIKPRNPLKPAKVSGIDSTLKSFDIHNLDNLSDLLAEVDSQQAYLPILLRQYLRLGGKLMGFNVDPAFNDCLDGLIYVDLCQTDPRLLEKFMSKAGIEAFYAYHAERQEKVA